MSLDQAQNISLEELDKQVLLHPVTSIAEHQTAGPVIYGRSGGVKVYDLQGKGYIDAAAALWCVNIGYGRTKLAEVAAEEMSRIGFFHTFGAASNEPQIRLAERLLSLLHEHADCHHIGKVFFGLSGSDGNDTQFKLVRYYNNLLGRPEKKKIISRHRRLSRRHRRGGEPHGHSALPQGLRPAHRGRAAHRLPALLAGRP